MNPVAAALFSSVAAPKKEQQADAVTAEPVSTPLLSQAQLKAALLDLLSDESFVAMLHRRYADTARKGAR